MSLCKDIFISHKNDGEGNNFAARLCADLEKLGYDIYYNPNEQHAGIFPNSLKKAVESCKDFLLILTQPCLEQFVRHDKFDWVREELLTAYRNGKNIIPLLMPGVTMPKNKEDMPEELQFLYYIECISVSYEYYDAVLNKLMNFFMAKKEIVGISCGEFAKTIEFKNMLLVCAPVKKCLEYKNEIKNTNTSNLISIDYDSFISEFIESIQDRNTTIFRQKYISCNILVIHDIQFIAGKESTQEELYWIIKKRIEKNNKTIIISARSKTDLSKSLSKELYALLSSETVKNDFPQTKAQNYQCEPYIGDNSYIFVSYSHKNMDSVLEIISILQKDGYRIWYDEGIDPGTEWDEYIAEKIEKSDYFISFISKEYMESKNCKDELNYARDLDKERLLIYLSDVKLTGGMAMRLNRLQAIHKYTYPSLESFICKIESTTALANHKSTNDSSC